MFMSAKCSERKTGGGKLPFANSCEATEQPDKANPISQRLPHHHTLGLKSWGRPVSCRQMIVRFMTVAWKSFL